MSLAPVQSPTVPLSNDLQIPVLGLGTSHYGGYSHDAVVYALTECGIRHIDTAKHYGCEAKLGEALRESGLPRSELWLMNKLWPGDYGYTAARKACLDSCSEIGVEYFDLSLRPGCSNREMRAETWRALDELYKKGVCRAIGVSNFLVHHLEQLNEDCTVVPHVNQADHLVISGLLEYCCWSIQNEVVTIPKSTKNKRIQENCQSENVSKTSGLSPFASLRISPSCCSTYCKVCRCGNLKPQGKRS